METRVEVDRLRRVYQQYAEKGFGSTKWSGANPGNRAIRFERDLKTRDCLRRAGFFPLGSRRILDVGCGTGEQLARFAAWGGVPTLLAGVDLIPERIGIARENHPDIDFQVANAECLPFAASSFHLVSVSTVFTSILDCEMATRVAAEITRVLTPGGAVLWYDFRINNPVNRHVRGISRRDIRKLFPGFRVVLDTVSLLPPLARRLGVFTNLLYRPLAALPFLRSHYLGLLLKG
jgi:SAM-dependent methyltransferase